MKTKAIIRKATAMIFLFITSICSNAQIPVIVKTLDITIYASEKYEVSKQNLFLLIDSSKCRLLSLNEVKTANGNQKAVIEIAVNDESFKIIDKCLPDMGYVSFKNLKTEDKSAELDTASVGKYLIFLKEQKTKYSQQLIKLKPDSEQYTEVWQQEAAIETQIFEKGKALESARIKLKAPHKIQITICE